MSDSIILIQLNELDSKVFRYTNFQNSLHSSYFILHWKQDFYHKIENCKNLQCTKEFVWSSAKQLGQRGKGGKIARSTNFCMFPQCKMWNSRVTQSSSFIFINLKEEEIKISTNIKYQYTGCPNKHGNSVTNSISSL